MGAELGEKNAGICMAQLIWVAGDSITTGPFLNACPDNIADLVKSLADTSVRGELPKAARILGFETVPLGAENLLMQVR